MNTEYSEYGNVKNVLESFPIFFFLFFKDNLSTKKNPKTNSRYLSTAGYHIAR